MMMDIYGRSRRLGGSAGYNLDGSGGTYNASHTTFIGYQAGKAATSGLKNTLVKTLVQESPTFVQQMPHLKEIVRKCKDR